MLHFADLMMALFRAAQPFRHALACRHFREIYHYGERLCHHSPQRIGAGADGQLSTLSDFNMPLSAARLLFAFNFISFYILHER